MRRLRCSASLLSLAALFAEGLHGQGPPVGAPDRTVLGLTLGAPLDIPECRKVETSRGVRYELIPDHFCFERPDVAHYGTGPVITSQVKFRFPYEEVPAFIDPTLGADGEVVDGNFEGIGYYTYGSRVAGDVLRALNAKYGLPTTEVPMTLRNLVGGVFEAFAYTWVVEEIRAEFQTIVSRPTTGRVDIRTTRALEAIDVRRRAYQRPHRPPR